MTESPISADQHGSKKEGIALIHPCSSVFIRGFFLGLFFSLGPLLASAAEQSRKLFLDVHNLPSWSMPRFELHQQIDIAARTVVAAEHGAE